jgi:hypothetical protein
MTDINNNITIDITGNTASMATDYGLVGSSLGSAHVPISKMVWGDADYGYRVDLSNPLPIQFAGQTGAIEISGKISGQTNGNIAMVNYIDPNLGGTLGVHYIAVAGSTNGSDPIGISGSVEGVYGGIPLTITGDVRFLGSMAADSYGTTESVKGILIQGTSAGATATVAGELFPGYGFGVPIAITGGRRLSSISDSIEVTGSVNVLGDRELTASTDAVSVYGYDGSSVVRTSLHSGSDGVTAGFSGDALKVAVTNGVFNITANVSAVTGVTNASEPPLRIQGFTAGDSHDPVIIRGENDGALEITATSALNTSVSGTVTIDDANIVSSLETDTKPLISTLSDIKGGTDNILGIKNDLSSGKGVKATISSITRPATLRSGSKTYTAPVASQLHNNLELSTGVTVKLSPSSHVNVLIGNRNLLNNDNNGYLLEPGESIYLEVNNINKVYAKPDTNIADMPATLYYIGS